MIILQLLKIAVSEKESISSVTINRSNANISRKTSSITINRLT